MDKAAIEARRNDLRSYLMKCVAQNIISLDDLLEQPLVVLTHLGATLLDDLKVVGAEMGKGAGSAGATMVAAGFMELAKKLQRKR